MDTTIFILIIVAFPIFSWLMFSLMLKLFNNRTKKHLEKIQTGPFAYAKIEEVTEIRRDGRTYCDCKIKYLDGYMREHETTIRLPHSTVAIPIGGEIKIRYNPEKFDDIDLVERTYMNTPEYIEKMEKAGFVRTRYGFERKDKVTFFSFECDEK